MVRTCSNCKERFSDGSHGMCHGYEMAETEKDCIEIAETCGRYREETEEDRERRRKEEEYTPSASAGDYSPSCPWNAPGMSIKDFI